MIPGQFGPTNLVFSCVLSISVILTISCCGIPSVIHTTRPISALIASSIPAAATGGGTKIALAFAPRLLHAIGDTGKDRLAQVRLPGFLGVGAADDIGAVFDCLLGVEGALAAGEALVEDFGVVVDAQVFVGAFVAGGGLDRCRCVACSGGEGRCGPSEGFGEGLAEGLHLAGSCGAASRADCEGPGKVEGEVLGSVVL